MRLSVIGCGYLGAVHTVAPGLGSVRPSGCHGARWRNSADILEGKNPL